MGGDGGEEVLDFGGWGEGLVELHQLFLADIDKCCQMLANIDKY